MGKLLQTTERRKVYTISEADQLIDEARNNANVEGYELIDNSIKRKQKKSKGEIEDEWYVVELKKKFAEERE